MQRSAWIFLAAIVLPSLGLAWLAVHSVRDQQVVLEHQQAIICQNITDALAKNIQLQMDQVRGDFVKTAEGLLDGAQSPQAIALNFNRQLKTSWPLAEIGFAVDLDGTIYAPRAGEGAAERTFRDENDRFLSNRENVEIYSSNSITMNQTASPMQNTGSGGLIYNIKAIEAPVRDKKVALAKNRDDAAQKPLTVQAPSNQSALGGNAKDKSASSTTVVAAIATGAVPSVQTEAVSDLDELKTKAPGSSPRTTAPTQNRPVDVPTMPAPSSAASSINAAITAQSVPIDSPTKSEVPATRSIPTGSGKAPVNSRLLERVTAAPISPAAPLAAQDLPTSTPESVLADSTLAPAADATSGVSNSFSSLSNATQQFAKIPRKVVPQQMVQQDAVTLSNTVPEESDFRRAIGEEKSGELARFLENKLRLLVWSHASADAAIVYGAQLNQDKLVEKLKVSFQIPELEPDSFSVSRSRYTENNYCVAILDDSGRPVAQSRSDFKGDWKHPLVSTEIGEALPHWEAALYLVDPGQIGRAARTLQFTLGLIVLLLVAAIVSGGSLIAADVRRQVRLAQQKTDFVSNVSHELKTPLTSIRMFADLLADKRVPDEERQATYLRIISAEAARLTRLINNVLDFARLERGAPPGEHRACDLVEAVRDVVETCGPHLENSGVTFRYEIETETLPINGDRDALAQIILNLISNAEKYGGKDVLVRVRRQETPATLLGCVDVLDRGAGIPARQIKTVFEPFHRLDDSLSSGIPGSGLGLTLARRMARAHGGDVTYSPRAGGGSCFTLTVPLTTKT